MNVACLLFVGGKEPYECNLMPVNLVLEDICKSEIIRCVYVLTCHYFEQITALKI